ncbi:hypothetical protein JCM5353_008748 [Sporobolomyces roseus]
MEPKGPTTWLAEVGPAIIDLYHLGAGDVAAGAIPAVFEEMINRIAVGKLQGSEHQDMVYNFRGFAFDVKAKLTTGKFSELHELIASDPVGFLAWTQLKHAPSTLKSFENSWYSDFQHKTIIFVGTVNYFLLAPESTVASSLGPLTWTSNKVRDYALEVVKELLPSSLGLLASLEPIPILISPPSAMPIPSLPIEIIHEIVVHLRTPEQGDTTEAIEGGQALSLVCRRWYPIGQALRWKDLRIDIASVPSLLAHFDLYPHLSRLVTTFKQLDSSNGRFDSSETDSSTDLDEEGFALLPKLLETLEQLRALNLEDVQSTFKPVLRAAAGLPGLHIFSLFTTLSLVWDTDVDSVFVAGFPSLRHFTLTSAAAVVHEIDCSQRPITRGGKRLQDVSLSWFQSEPDILVQSILSTMDLAALRTLFLGGVPADTFPFESLSSCLNLRSLRIFVFDSSLASNFPALLSNLPKATSLKNLEYTVVPRTISYASPLTLDALFASFPSTLALLLVPQLLLTASDLSQDWPLTSVESRDGLCFVQGLTMTSEGVRCVEFWKERGAQEKKTYRCILDYSSWDEHDAKTSEST